MRWWPGFLVGLAVLVAGCNNHAEVESVWLGHVVPLTGPDRLQGEHARQGVLLAVKEAHDRGWNVAGQPLAVRHADATADQVTGQGVRLLAVNRVVALLAGPDAQAAEELVRAARAYGNDEVVKASRPLGATVIVPGVLPSVVTGEFWALGVRPAWRGRVLARYASGSLNARRAVVLLEGRDALASELADAFAREWGQKEGATVSSWRVGPDGPASDLVQRAVGNKAEVVLVAAGRRAESEWRSALRKAGYAGPVLLGGEDRGADALEIPAEAGDSYAATVYAREGLSDRGKEFARVYEARFGQAPDDNAAGAYDAALLALETLPEAAQARVRLREMLARRESFEGVTGPIHWVDGQARRRVFVVRVSAGGKQVVQTVEPEG